MFRREQVEEARARNRQESKSNYRALHLVHAVPPMAVLTGSAEWNKYLEIVSGMIKAAEEQRAGILNSLSSPKIVNHDQIISLKLQLASVDSALSTMRGLLELPKTIIDAGKQAEQNLTNSNS